MSNHNDARGTANHGLLLISYFKSLMRTVQRARLDVLSSNKIE